MPVVSWRVRSLAPTLCCHPPCAQVPCRELFFRTYEAKLGAFVPPRLQQAA